ncbi:hypothetical protein LIA77_05357 [Sarocladium implicatum]|nr:hypothetical protein LIA77_05357 [Sarocladium implicatum]
MSLLLDIQYILARLYNERRLAGSKPGNHGELDQIPLPEIRSGDVDALTARFMEIREGQVGLGAGEGRGFDFSLVAIDVWAHTEFLEECGDEVMEIGRWSEQEMKPMAEKALDFFRRVPHADSMMIGSSLFLVPRGLTAPMYRLGRMSRTCGPRSFVPGIIRNVSTDDVFLILESAAADGPGLTVLNAIVAALALMVNTFRVVEHATARVVLNRAAEMIRAERAISLEDAVDELQGLVKQVWYEIVNYAVSEVHERFVATQV